MGKLDEIPGGVRRSPRLATEGGLDAKKESYLWNAVKFSYKVSCVTHAVKSYTDYAYVIWIDDDTYTEILSAAAEAGVQVRKMTEYEPDLEDIFLLIMDKLGEEVRETGDLMTSDHTGEVL